MEIFDRRTPLPDWTASTMPGLGQPGLWQSPTNRTFLKSSGLPGRSANKVDCPVSLGNQARPADGGLGWALQAPSRRMAFRHGC